MVIHTGFLFFILSIISILFYSSNLHLLFISLVWILGVSTLYYLTIKKGNVSRYRSIFFFILSLSFLFELHLFSAKDTNLLPYCHIGMAGNFLSVFYNQFLSIINNNWLRYGTLSIGILWLLIIFVNGQGFCSWICFLGGVDDCLSQIFKKPFIKVSGFLRVREFQFAILIFFAFMSFVYVEPLFCKWLCPFKISNSILNPNAKAYIFQTITYIFAGGVFLVILPLLTKKRIFCSTICPFGAIPPLFNKFIPYKMTIDQSKCTGCRRCVEVCPSFAIAEKENGIHITRYCTLCARCVSHCKSNCIEYTLFDKRKSYILPFISLLLGGTISLFYVPSAMFNFLKALGVFFGT